jgi:hypothetical protein
MDDDEEETSEIKLNKDILQGNRSNNTNNSNTNVDLGFSSSTNNNKNTTSNSGGTFFDPFGSTPETNNNIANNETKTTVGISGLDDLFGVSSSNSNNNNNNNTNTNLFGLSNTTNNTGDKNDTGNTNTNTGVGGIDFFNMTPSNNKTTTENNLGFMNNNTNTNNNTSNSTGGGLDFGLFGGGNTLQDSNTQNNNNVISYSDREIFKNSDIRIGCQVNKESQAQMTVIYQVSNLISNNFSNVKLTFLATKSVTVKVNLTSATSLESNIQNGIKKEISITNNDLSKDVVLKLKIGYNNNGTDVNESITLKDFSS